MAANLASSAASSILDSILVGSDFPIVHLLSLFFFEMSIAKTLTSFWPHSWVTWKSDCLILKLTEISTDER